MRPHCLAKPRLLRTYIHTHTTCNMHLVICVRITSRNYLEFLLDFRWLIVAMKQLGKQIFATRFDAELVGVGDTFTTCDDPENLAGLVSDKLVFIVVAIDKFTPCGWCAVFVFRCCKKKSTY